MDTKDKEKAEAYMRAKKKVEDIKDFYIHLLVYICINLFISIKKIARNLDNGETFNEAFFDFGTFFVWIAWGIGLALHGYNVFVENAILGSRWEARKVKEYMNEETSDRKEY